MNENRADSEVRMATRAFAMELSMDEVEMVAGGISCTGTATTHTGNGAPEPDKDIDCTF